MAKYNDVSANDTIDEIYRRNDVHDDELHALKTRSHIGIWINPTLMNSFAHSTTPYGPFQYRKVFNDHLEFQGYVNVSAATSGTVAFTLIPSHRPINNSSYIVDVYSSGTIIAGRLSVTASTGQVILVWPLPGTSVLGAWVAPSFINGWGNAGSPYDDVAYRTGPSGLEFKGHCTGGASGTIAFYLSAAYWPVKDLSTITDVVTTTTPGAAQVYVTASNGAVKITSII